jgi:signal transduction histidine kinase/ligand-binding sensor domain-containing protein
VKLNKTAQTFIIAFAAFVYSGAVKAQQYPAPGVAIFGAAQGLKQNTITHLFKDNEGFMWVGTFAGMHRYNGYEFELLEKYNPHLKKELGSPVRDAIKLGNYLYYSTESHLFKLNLSSYKVTVVNAFEYLNPCCFYRTSTNQIFIYQFNEKGGVFQLDTANNQLIPFFTDSIIRNYEEVARLGDSLLLINDSTAGWLNLLASTGELKKADMMPVKTAHAIHKNQLILVDEGGNAKVQWAASDAQISTSNFKKPYRVFRLNDGFAVANGTGELQFFDENFQFKTSLIANQLGLSEQLNGSMVNSLIQDNSGTIWIGVDGVGLVRVNRLLTKFNQFPSAEAKGSFVRKIVEHNEALWAGTISKLVKYDDNETKSFDLPIVGTGLCDLIVFDRNRLLMTIDNSLWFFDVQKEQFESLKVVADDFRLSNIAKTSGGKFYVSQLFGKAILELQNSGKTNVLTTVLHAPESIKSLYSLGEEKLLVALSAGGYQLADLSTKTISKELHLAGYKITDCCELNGEFWLTTANGLIRLKQNFMPSTGDVWPEPLNEEYFYALTPDLQNRWWLSSNNGLYCFDAESGQLNHFTELHGLQNNEFNTRCSALLANGSIAFGGIKGINIFFPDQISIDSYVPLPVITLIENAGKAVEFIQAKIPNLELAQDQVALHIQLNSLNFSASELNLFEYAIQIDETINWVPLGNNPEFYLQALAPGYYTILVRASNSDGVWSEPSAIFYLKVSPPFYKKWWFLLLISVGIAGMGFYLIFVRYKQSSERQLADLQRQQALDSMRQRIADDIHDDLGAGLTHLTLLARQMQISDIEKSDQYSKLSELSRSLTQSLRQVIWAMKPEMDTTQSLFSAINKYAHSFLETAHIEVEVIRSADSKDIHINPMQRQCAMLVLKEALNNVVKHSGATRVDLEVNQYEGIFEMVIRDNGIGFNTTIGELGTGLKSMYRRAKDAGGSIKYESTLGGPSQVVLTLNLNSTESNV